MLMSSQSSGNSPVKAKTKKTLAQKDIRLRFS